MGWSFDKGLEGLQLIGLVFMFVFLILSCKQAVDEKEHKLDAMIASIKEIEIVPGSLAEQEKAFEALNTLQVRMKGEHLFSTFSGISHNCNRPDSIFVISQSDLKKAMDSLVASYGTDIPLEEQSQLVENAVLAQENYVVQSCYGSSMQLVEGAFESIQSHSLQGTWILPKVVDKRDVVIIW